MRRKKRRLRPREKRELEAMEAAVEQLVREGKLECAFDDSIMQFVFWEKDKKKEEKTNAE